MIKTNKIPKFVVKEILEYTDIYGKERALTRLIREDGYPFAISDNKIIYPEFYVTEEDKKGIYRALDEYIATFKPIQTGNVPI